MFFDQKDVRFVQNAIILSKPMFFDQETIN